MELLKFLGRGGAFNAAEGSNSAFYKKDNYLLLIDCGCSTFSNILKSGVLGWNGFPEDKSIDEIDIYITHTHDDHIGSLSSLLFYIYNENIFREGHGKSPVMVNVATVGSQFHNLEEVLICTGTYKLFFGPGHPFTLRKISQIEVGGDHILIPTFADHFIYSGSVEQDACGYAIYFTEENQYIYYSGDTKKPNCLVDFESFKNRVKEISPKTAEDLADPKEEYYYMDACVVGDMIDDYPHETIKAIMVYFKEKDLDLSKLRLMHIDDKTTMMEAENKGLKVVKRYDPLCDMLKAIDDTFKM